MNRLILYILCFFLLASCSSDQVREDAEGLDRQTYLIGTGSADNEENAKQRARSNLAKIFEVEVKEDTSDYSQFRSNNRQGKKSIKRSWQVDRSISTYTNRVLEGVQIASVKQNEKSKQYRAVAVLPRKQASSYLTAQIQTLDSNVRQLMSEAIDEQDKIKKLRLLYQALKKQKQRDQLQKALVIVDSNGVGLPTDVSFWQIQDQLDKTLASIRFSLDIKPNQKIDLYALLDSAIANVGAKTDKQGDYQLKSTIKVYDLGKIQGWNWYKALLTLKITDSGHRTLVAKKVTVKVAALDAPSAKIKLQKKLLSYTEQVLTKMILGKTALSGN